MNVRQLETLERNKEKKTSKIKKFFKKLSHKKDANKYEDVDHLAVVTSRHHDDRLPSTESEHSNSNNNFNSSRRRSDGTISLYSVNDATNCYLTQATPSTKRRLFAINLSFMKKGRRQQQRNDNNNTKNDVIITDKPSDTVRALCSPYASRRNRLMSFASTPVPLASGGRRASESTVYRIQQQQDINNSPPYSFTRNNTATTSTNFRQQQPNFSIPCKHNKLRQQLSTPTMTTTGTSTNKALLANYRFLPQLTPSPPPSGSFPPHAFSRRGSASSADEVNYINYPFSKSNVVAPRKPTRNASKGSKGSFN